MRIPIKRKITLSFAISLICSIFAPKMDTQNTPVHIRLWHRDFWLLALVNLLLSTVVYMQLSALGNAMTINDADKLTTIEQALIIGIYGLGIFLLGPYCHYLAQRYKRKRVCQIAVMGMAVMGFTVSLAACKMTGYALFVTCLLGMFWYGAFFGLAQMVLSSILIIDITESAQRTEANYSSAWFRRFALAIGPLLTIVLPIRSIAESVCLWFYIAVIILISLVHIPFKSPDDNGHVFCIDRFIMPQGFHLTLNLLPVTIVLGMSAAMAFHNEVFFIQLGTGLILAFIAEKFVFANADLQSEFICGGMLIAAALLLYIFRSGMPIVEVLAPTLIGIGTGLIGGRMQLFFIKLAHHCQRGTAQSSFFLSWELGIAVGMFLTLWLVDYHILDVIGLGLIVFALLLYHFCTHPWYVKHRNR